MTTQPAHTVTALPTGLWRLDPDQTTITVTAKKFGFYRVPATLTVQSGTIEIDADHQVRQISDVEFDGGTGSFRATATVDRNAIGVDKLPSLIIAPTLELTVAATAAVANT